MTTAYAYERPELVIIAAVCARDRLIGRGVGLPWPPIREDLQRFKRLTRGHALIVGRCTFESIIHQFGRPLPERRMVVLTSKGPLPDYPHIETYTSLKAALKRTRDESTVFIAGGTRPYREALPLAHRLELTLVEGTYRGDTYFPPYDHYIGTRYALAEKRQREGFAFLTYRLHDAGTASAQESASAAARTRS